MGAIACSTIVYLNSYKVDVGQVRGPGGHPSRVHAAALHAAGVAWLFLVEAAAAVDHKHRALARDGARTVVALLAPVCATLEHIADAAEAQQVGAHRVPH